MTIQTVDDGITETPSLQESPPFFLVTVLSLLVHGLFLGILFITSENPFLHKADTRNLSVIPIHLSPPVLHQAARKDSLHQAPVRRMIGKTHDVSGKKQNRPIHAADSQAQTPGLPGKAPMRAISRAVGSEAPSPGTQTETVTSKSEVLLPATSGGFGKYPVTTTDPSLVKPRYALTPSPAYPRSARNQGQEGVVLLSVEVLADGRTGRLLVKKSSGYALLDRSALEAVRAWRFEPARRKQTPLAMTVDIPIRFSLKKDD